MNRRPAVPTTRDVRPGARVDIVLKADQPTGRTVAGVVRDVLTRGDHPRGIKVRLADGRVGRVQSVAAAGAGVAAAGELPLQQQQQQQQWGGGDELLVPTREVGLDAYVKPARRGGRGRGRGRGRAAGEVASGDGDDPAGAREGGGSPPQQDEPGISKCPVCEVFEGDEAAVAHHVSGHFDD